MFSYLSNSMLDSVRECNTTEIHGKVLKVLGTIIRVSIGDAKIGEICRLTNPKEQESILAEVVGFEGDVALLTPLGDLRGISTKTKVTTTRKPHTVNVSDNMLGRVLDGMGNPVDQNEKGLLLTTDQCPIYTDPPDALLRQPIDKPISLGVRAVDGFMTCGEGQRLGIFAAAGVGKSTLLAMLARNADVDVTVLVLIGERGREVREFIDQQLGPEGMTKTVVIAATADKAPMIRVRAAYVGTTIAEYYRNKGKRVLLLMDSVTRFARALREVGLAAGEIPTRRGYPPSVFSDLPKLFERAGQSDRGSITAIYTVLVEGDDMNEPVSDETRSLLDGHIILSSKLAQSGHFPAIDIPKSLSRVMNNIVNENHMNSSKKLRELITKQEEIEFLVRMGEYSQGSDSLADEALNKKDAIRSLLCQDLNERVPILQTINLMEKVIRS